MLRHSKILFYLTSSTSFGVLYLFCRNYSLKDIYSAYTTWRKSAMKKNSNFFCYKKDSKIYMKWTITKSSLSWSKRTYHSYILEDKWETYKFRKLKRGTDVICHTDISTPRVNGLQPAAFHDQLQGTARAHLQELPVVHSRAAGRASSLRVCSGETTGTGGS